jgi:hypothetical protein
VGSRENKNPLNLLKTSGRRGKDYETKRNETKRNYLTPINNTALNKYYSYGALSYGISRHLVSVVLNVSEETSASVFRVCKAGIHQSIY